jgi:hypothetical protein
LIRARREAGIAAIALKSRSVRTLHAFERLADGIDVASGHFESGPAFEIGPRFIGPAEPAIGQGSVEVDPWVLAATSHGFREGGMSHFVVSRKIGVHAAPVQFIQQLILRPAHRGEQRAGHRRR